MTAKPTTATRPQAARLEDLPLSILLPSSFTLYYIPAGIAPDTQMSVWFSVKLKVTSRVTR